MSHGKVTRSVLELCPVSIDLYNYLNINNECEDIDCNNGYRVDILRWRGRHDLFDEDNDGHLLAIPYQKYLARFCQDVSRFGKLARNLFQIHANFLNLQESFLSCKILVPNPCENFVLLDFWPDSSKILKRSCQDSFQDLGKIFS